VQALKQWQAEKPDLFLKRVYEHTGLDNHKPFEDPAHEVDAYVEITGAA
jgi:hypothetical protein